MAYFCDWKIRFFKWYFESVFWRDIGIWIRWNWNRAELNRISSLAKKATRYENNAAGKTIWDKSEVWNSNMWFRNVTVFLFLCLQKCWNFITFKFKLQFKVEASLLPLLHPCLFAKRDIEIEKMNLWISWAYHHELRGDNQIFAWEWNRLSP